MELFLLAHGVDANNLDVITYRELLHMYANGMLGNRKVLELQATILGALLNYMSGGKPKSLGMHDILGSSWDFWVPPKSQEEEQEEQAKITKQNMMALFMTHGGMQ